MSLSPSSAGTVMFVYRMHLSREVRTIKGLQKQVNAYLVCLTCLQLIRPEYSWIVQSGAVGKKCLVTGVLLSWGGFSSQAFTYTSHQWPLSALSPLVWLEENNSRLNHEKSDLFFISQMGLKPKDENRQSQSLSSACAWTP
ncbi:unnamed protein product [Ranitomeya imitator]|uniref:NUP160 middle TPR domain-containing protein n=1 Tax=Ranitomeya imitator TaxID=111125 RepID=A0ABN9L1K3_9NEOB|nr:unnamed protein product [Ranitomeya imitator]